eukprot:m.110808 g.110808  ORF g.110808 m.110808 type:complete len:556 (-) comp10730_c2_seq2:361-2028(-)
MPPKKKKDKAAATKAALNLSVLQRVDPQITRIEASTAHATLYKLEGGKEWQMEDVAGAFFLFARKVAPYYGIHIMNQKAFDNYHRLIQPGDSFEMQAAFLMFNDDGEYYGLWFGVDTDRDAMCKLVMDRAAATTAGSQPVLSYAAMTAAASTTPDPEPTASPAPNDSVTQQTLTEQDLLKNLLGNAAAAASTGAEGGGGSSDGGHGNSATGPTGGGGGALTAGTEQAHLASLLGAALRGPLPDTPATATGGAATTSSGGDGGSGGEAGHLQHLLANAAGGSAASPSGTVPHDASGSASGGGGSNHLAGLLMNAARSKSGGGGGGVVASGTAAAHAHSSASTLLPAPTLPSPLQPGGSNSTDNTTIAVKVARRSASMPAGGGTPRAPKAMAHLLQNPGMVTKVAVAPTPTHTAPREPTVLERMREGVQQGTDGPHHPHPHRTPSAVEQQQSSSPRSVGGRVTDGAGTVGALGGTSPLNGGQSCEATAMAVQQSVTNALTELVDLQNAKASARGIAPRCMTQDELRKVLLHVLASTENDTLLAAFFAHYSALFASRS